MAGAPTTTPGNALALLTRSQKIILAVAIGVRVLAVVWLFLATDHTRVPFGSFFGDEEYFVRRSMWLRNVALGIPIHSADLIYAFDAYSDTSQLYILGFLQAVVGFAPYGAHLVGIAGGDSVAPLVFTEQDCRGVRDFPNDRHGHADIPGQRHLRSAPEPCEGRPQIVRHVVERAAHRGHEPFNLVEHRQTASTRAKMTAKDTDVAGPIADDWIRGAPEIRHHAGGTLNILCVGIPGDITDDIAGTSA
jgi:hypothetical protein